jgi:hypothetical protein
MGVDAAFVPLELTALSQWAGTGRLVPETDSGHVGTISITVRACSTQWNAMKPRIHRVLTQ